MPLTLTKTSDPLRWTASGALDANEAAVVYTFDNFKGKTNFNVSCQGTVRSYLEFSHDGGVTWTRLFLNNLAAVTGATSGYTVCATLGYSIIAPNIRIVLLDTSGATNNFRIDFSLIPLDNGGF